MDFEKLVEQMALNAGRIGALVEGVSEEQARWKPAPEVWSILEVMHHLWDEEREDFRVRLNLILHARGARVAADQPAGLGDRAALQRRSPGGCVGGLPGRTSGFAGLAAQLETSRTGKWRCRRLGVSISRRAI